jgi:hypothetical protein
MSCGYSVKLFSTLCRCAYWPLRKLARLGEQSELVVNALANRTPSAARRSMFGVFRNG